MTGKSPPPPTHTHTHRRGIGATDADSGRCGLLHSSNSYFELLCPSHQKKKGKKNRYMLSPPLLRILTMMPFMAFQCGFLYFVALVCLSRSTVSGSVSHQASATLEAASPSHTFQSTFQKIQVRLPHEQRYPVLRRTQRFPVYLSRRACQ